MLNAAVEKKICDDYLFSGLGIQKMPKIIKLSS